MSKPRDYGYEALAEATGTDLVAGRGELNISLKTIRQQEPALTDYALADEIHRRAKLYRDVMGDDIMCTPTALAKHWKRVVEEAKPSVRGTNRHGSSQCDVCGGDQMVLVEMRGEQEVYAPCYSCNPIEVKAFRHDGTVFRTPDPGRVRELMNG